MSCVNSIVGLARIDINYCVHAFCLTMYIFIKNCVYLLSRVCRCWSSASVHPWPKLHAFSWSEAALLLWVAVQLQPVTLAPQSVISTAAGVYVISCDVDCGCVDVISCEVDCGCVDAISCDCVGPAVIATSSSSSSDILPASLHMTTMHQKNLCHRRRILFWMHCRSDRNSLVHIGGVYASCYRSHVLDYARSWKALQNVYRYSWSQKCSVFILYHWLCSLRRLLLRVVWRIDTVAHDNCYICQILILRCA